MLIGQQKSIEIKDKIMHELFTTPNLNLKELEHTLVDKAYDLWIADYLPIINKLPKDLFVYSSSVEMITTDDEQGRWRSHSQSKNSFICLVDGTITWRLREKPFFQPTEIEEEVQQLIAKKAKLETEEEEMRIYLQNSFALWNTTAKLRKNWPKTLHKFIPEEPPRKPRKKKNKTETVNTPEITAPVGIQARMTLNILESD